MSDKHNKKKVLITGTNHGLGLSLTKLFLEHNYIVFAGTYKLAEDSQINSIKDNENLFIFDLDVTDIKTIDKAEEFVKSKTDTLDILINNAGILCPDSYVRNSLTIFDKLDVDAMKEVYDVNALGALRVANAFSSLLIKGDEKLLINISSEAGSIGDCTVSDWHGYRMSKSAMNMAGALIQNDYVKHGGRVWQIHPGWMQTYMHGRHSPEANHSSDFSAEHLYKLILNADAQKKDELAFMDILGQPLPW
ncbi:MAG: SDR family NAD(P)-dependent oxidoreductase [Oscillospiraceae bacterium]|nr:SDR family NAD(P)-dependent oxidoreductase [Oscillospiraceae bacterium]